MTTANSFGFTQQEARYLARKPQEPSFPIFWTIVFLLAVTMLIHLTVEPVIVIPEAHAAEVLKTNADYCHEWQHGMWNVVGATDVQMNKLCGEYLTK